MGMGNNKSLVDFWNRELHRWGSVSSMAKEEPRKINYDDYPFVKRWLLILGQDWGEGKRRFYCATENHKFMRLICRESYVFCRRVFRTLNKLND